MTGDPEIQVSRLLDEGGFGPFQIRMLIWTIILGMIDGYDIGAIAFAAPHLVRDWHLQPGDVKWVLTASNIGVLFGSQLMGFVGDRYGRKTTLIVSNLLFGVLTFAAAYSTDLMQLFWLRFFAGFGIGGVIPNIVAINAESAPRRLRATVAIIAVGFVPTGGALAGFASAALIPHYGWPILFYIGGVIPVVAALGGMIGLPESIKYMALHESGRAKMANLVAAIRPGFEVPANARFVIEDEQQAPSSNPVYLFRNGMWLITPLLWLLFTFNLMGYFFLISWTPTMLAAAQLPQATAALAGAALQIGGTVGALVLCWWLQRHRFFAIAILFVAAVPVVASIGYAGMTSAAALLAATFLGGFLVLGIQSGINVSGALVYPTSLRANGSGWELGLGRLGSIIGPLLGALFVGLSVEKLYVWSALPFAAGAIVCFAIHVLNTARLNANPELKQAQ
jgi:MFS transporter, AAHS family, 4-hydroxybenzoate transporter